MNTMSMENMYTQLNIKIDALHDLVMSMKQDMDRRFVEVDRRFDEVDRKFVDVDRRFDDVDRRFEEVDHRFEEASEFRKEVQRNFARLEGKIDTLEAKVDSSTARLEAKIDKNTELVSELYLRGDKLELSFSRNVLLGNSALAGIVAFFVALFTGRMIIEN